MGGWRLHVLLWDDDPLIGELFERPGAVLAVAEQDGRPWREPTLTSRERRVLQLIADGASIAEAARTLYISSTTVKTHLRHVAEKLGVRGRAAIVAEAMRRGLII